MTERAAAPAGIASQTWEAEPRVVVVDDQPANADVLKALLLRAGYRDLHAFTDPRAAVEAMRVIEPDLLIVDLHMPVLDGVEVIRILRTEIAPGRYVPVLMVTGDADRQARDRALSSGAQDFVAKPFDVSEVVLRVRNLLQTRWLHEELERRRQALSDEVVLVSRALDELRSERELIARALARLRPRLTADETARAICVEVHRLPFIAAAAIIRFDRAGGAVPVAGVGTRRHVLGRPLPPTAARYLTSRCAWGPWLDRWQARPDGSLPGTLFPEPDIAAVIYAPIPADGGPVGVLALGTEGLRSDEALASRLPAAAEFAGIAAALLGSSFEADDRVRETRDHLREVVEGGGLWPVFQPVRELSTGALVGFEALTRFADATSPQRRFADAEAVGAGAALEMACIDRALADAAALPSDAWLSVNVSPAVAADHRGLGRLLDGVEREIVLEITEHARNANYPAFRRSVDRLRPPVRLAVDDAGAGFASFRHILELQPDYVKLDTGIVRSIERDAARQAFVAGMSHFATRTGTVLIAEGIETEVERTTLESLAVRFGQGHLFGKPGRAPRWADARRHQLHRPQ